MSSPPWDPKEWFLFKQDKILQPYTTKGNNEKIVITNDGATILKSLWVENPSAKILIDISKNQDTAVGDGTTTVAVLASEFLREAEKLVQSRMHPQIIISGYRKARDVAKKALLSHALNHSLDSDAFRKDLINIARTTLSSKLLTHEKDFFANLVVEAVLRFKTTQPNLEYIKIIKKPGSTLKESFLSDGLILEKSIGVGCPKFKKDAKILVANTPMDYDKIKIYGSRVKVDSTAKVAEIEEAEKEKMKGKIEKVLAHGMDVFINRQLIYDYPLELLSEKGIMVIEHADFDGIERLSAVTGSDIVSTFDSPEKTKLGFAATVEEMIIGEDKVIKFSGCQKNEACTIVLRGASSHLLDEAERSLHDALCVIVETVQSKNVIYGGGYSEMVMSKAVDDLANETAGKEQMAIAAFAKALRELPYTIANNAGLDAAELTSNLKKEIYGGSKTAGIDVFKGKVGSMDELGVFECLKVKEQALISACEAAEMIIRVDQIISCAPRQRDRE